MRAQNAHILLLTMKHAPGKGSSFLVSKISPFILGLCIKSNIKTVTVVLYVVVLLLTRGEMHVLNNVFF